MASGCLALSACGSAFAESFQSNGRCPIVGFTKPFQTASAERTAEIVSEIGWDGIECPVRPKGQIEPERVEEELPRLAEALRGAGREIAILSTGIKSLDPLAEKVLRTASKLGIRRYRLGFWHYNTQQSLEQQIAEIRSAMRDLAALNKELGLHGAHQNHSGVNYFGAPIWDIHQAVQEYNGDQFGICFDIGHATIEGGLSWPIQARLMRPYYMSVFVKDFRWNKSSKGWKAEWCPLGEGMVQREFFQMLKQTGYSGPICQHHEYELGTGAAMIAAMKKDLEVLKSWMRAEQ